MSIPNFDEWTVRASDVFTVALTKNDLNLFEPFEPPFADFITSQHGLADTVIGYKKPHAVISFRASDMSPTAYLSHQAKFGNFNINYAGITKIPDLKDLLLPFLPARAFDEKDDSLPQDWTPPGHKVHTYDFEGDEFEIWKSSLSDPATYKLLENMAILIPMFIESGTTELLKEDKQSIVKWTVYLLYQHHQHQGYIFAGLSTTYRFETSPHPEAPIPFSIPDPAKTIQKDAPEIPQPDSFDSIFSSPEPSPLPNSARERLSQFLLLPPFQNKSHGLQLYAFIYQTILADPTIFELTVEDPNESFDNLRDYADYTHLLSDPIFASVRLISSTKSSIAEKVPLSELLPPRYHQTLCRKHKIIRRQIDRLTEMHLLRQIPPLHRNRLRIMTRGANSAQENDRKYYFWRLLVKARVAKRNAEGLREIDDKSERINRLEGAVDSIEEGYKEILAGWEKRVEKGYLIDPEQPSMGAERKLVNGKGKGKRTRIFDEDSSDEASTPKRQATEPLQ